MMLFLIASSLAAAPCPLRGGHALAECLVLGAAPPTLPDEFKSLSSSDQAFVVENLTGALLQESGERRKHIADFLVAIGAFERAVVERLPSERVLVQGIQKAVRSVDTWPSAAPDPIGCAVPNAKTVVCPLNTCSGTCIAHHMTVQWTWKGGGWSVSHEASKPMDDGTCGCCM